MEGRVLRSLLHRAPRPLAVLLGLLSLLALLPTPVLADDGLAIGSTGVASGEALRDGPSWDAGIIGEVAAGTQVIIADGPITAADGSLWYQVDAAGQLGYLPTYAVSAIPADATTGTTSGDGTTGDPASQDTAPVEPIGTVYIVGTDGDGAACRAEASHEAVNLVTLPEGSAVDATGGAVGEWQPVACAGTVGYVNLAYVSWEPPAVDEPAAETSEPAADPAQDTTTSEETLAAEAAPADGGRRGGGGGSADGQAIADYALQYVGYPYVYAGEGPDGFDCSGFTKWVILQTLGIDITHDMFVQVGMGTGVGFNELQPGDLVFFANTFRPGLSHAGIYVGGGQFVHAENESTGVKVSDLNSDYYSSRWYGATRLV